VNWPSTRIVCHASRVHGRISHAKRAVRQLGVEQGALAYAVRGRLSWKRIAGKSGAVLLT